MSFTTAGRAFMLGIAAVALAGTAQAQAPTPEGTTIRNEATATYTDGTTTYTAPMAFVEVTVGFKAGATLPGTDGSQTPAAGSTGNEYTFTATNSGNGVDTLSFLFTPSGNITITGYRIDGGAILTPGAFATAIEDLALAAAGTVDVTVIYSVASITGGSPETIDVVATSVRDGAVSDTHQLDIVPASVAVTPDADPVSHLPGSYSETFTITNNSSLPMTYELTAGSSTPATATTGAITAGAGGTFTAGATPTLALAAGASGTVVLAYTIPSSAASAATTTLGLTATSTGTPVVSDGGSYALTVNRPTVVMTKEAWLDDRTAQISGPVIPGQFIQYKIIVRNTGNFAATDVTVDDALPAQVSFTVLGGTTADAAGWDFTGTTTTDVKAVLDTLATGGAATERFFWIRVQIR